MPCGTVTWSSLALLLRSSPGPTTSSAWRPFPRATSTSAAPTAAFLSVSTRPVASKTSAMTLYGVNVSICFLLRGEAPPPQRGFDFPESEIFSPSSSHLLLLLVRYSVGHLHSWLSALFLLPSLSLCVMEMMTERPDCLLLPPPLSSPPPPPPLQVDCMSTYSLSCPCF